MSGNREIILPDQITNNEIIEKIIDLGMPADIIKQLHLSDLEKITSEPLDLKNLYFNILKIQEGTRDSGHIVLRAHANRAWKILCLTGQLPYIHYAHQLILKDKSLDLPDITPAVQQDCNIIEAMNYTAYSGNIGGLTYLFAHLVRKELLSTNFVLQKIILFNSVCSNKAEAVKWLVENLNINVRALRMVENIFFMSAKLGNAEILRYTYEELKRPEDRYSTQLNFALFLAFESGNIPAIDYIHSLGVSYKSTNQNGDNGFHLAALKGHAHAMRFAVSVGIDPNDQNNKGVTALHNAAGNGDIQAMQCAIELGARLDLDTPDGLGVLHFCASSGNIDAFKYLISLIDPKTIEKKLNNDPEIIKSIIQFGMGVEGIKFAITCGFNLFIKIDQFGSNLLTIAAASSHGATNKAIVQYLLDEGLKPEKNSKNTSMLHMAAMSGDQEMVYLTVKALKEHQQEINFTNRDDFGSSAIAYAAQSEHSSKIITAIDELNVKNNYFGQSVNNYSLAKWGYIFARIRNFLIQNRVELKTNPLIVQCTQLSNDIYPLINNSIENTVIIHRLRRIGYQLKQILPLIENNKFPVDILILIQSYMKLVNNVMTDYRKPPRDTSLPSDVITKIASHMRPREMRGLLCTSSFFASSPEISNILDQTMALQWQIIVGSQHSLFLHTSGQLFGSGRNDKGQLGQGDKIDKKSLVPIVIPNNGLVKEVAAGDAHTLVLSDDGQLFGFGNNSEGQLGFAELHSQLTPRLIAIPDNAKVKQVVTGKYYTGCYTVILCENNLVYSFGSNKKGQLGLGYTSDIPIIVPTLVPFPDGMIPQQLIAGGNHTLVLCNNGLYGFGNNSHGQLGLGDQIDVQSSPVIVPLPGDIKPKQICAGGFHTLVLSKTGRLFGVGANAAGELGLGEVNDSFEILDNKYNFRLISLPADAIPLQIIAAGQTSFFVSSDNHIYAFGINRWGQLGVGDTNARDKPARIFLYNKIPLQIAASGTHTFILCNDNTLYGCGYNSYGQLGIASERENFVKPFQVKFLPQIQKLIEEEESKYLNLRAFK